MQLSSEQVQRIRERIVRLFGDADPVVVLDNNRCDNAAGRSYLEFAAAWGAKRSIRLNGIPAFQTLKEMVDENRGEYLFGYLTYDLKNEIEALGSSHADHIGFSPLHFFVPRNLILIDALGQVTAGKEWVELLLKEEEKPVTEAETNAIQLNQRVSAKEYIEQVSGIREHIEAGDVYELNYCVEFFASQVKLDPWGTYRNLVSYSPTPFAAYVRHGVRYLMCASPERFMGCRNGVLFSQPIKGTIRRGATPEEDEQQRNLLRNSEKEQAENLMIVDLVRNDLARSSAVASVQVDELFGIYPFRNLFQMISTISSKKSAGVHPVEAIRSAFPMGSMTGAPKIKAMELIEQYESTKRGLYAGAVGYFTPTGDFDFNVVIRGLQYNQETGYLNFEVGSAITYDSDPQSEYAECLLKARSMMAVISGLAGKSE